jgi:hypothetical protein
MFADLGYKERFLKWLKDTFNITSEVSQQEPGFKPTRKRRVVERTFA